jgi:hypothetical protein
MDKAISDKVEVVPVVVLSQTFPARPSSIPDIRDFVRRCLAQSPLSEEDNREVGETVAQALLDAAGSTGAINVSFRIFPDHVEVDVLRSGAQIGTPAGLDALASLLKAQEPPTVGRNGASEPDGDHGGRRPPARGLGQDGQPLGRRHHRAAAARPAPDPRAVRRLPPSVITWLSVDPGRPSTYGWPRG